MFDILEEVAYESWLVLGQMRHTCYSGFWWRAYYQCVFRRNGSSGIWAGQVSVPSLKRHCWVYPCRFVPAV